ncbi:hypothetical protein CBR_g6576 [Chara braunii]|uniref:SET domain-containing protein n=1 Tax=Chara braunii TaxID=69332 RepID=A0A388KKD1_CHABU|nr:hypothetical protein CBR_g6576 [Chara braunii]|eukprot:GBG70448.1 hypothetical protein CBR_g6576 [Chara braunii]
MAASSLRKWLGKIPFKSRLFPGLDQRRLQHEIDVHKLFLLTSYHRLGTPVSSNAIQEIERLSMKLPFDEQVEKVQENVHIQVMDIARTIHRAIAAVHGAGDGSTDGLLENDRTRGPVQNGGRTENFSSPDELSNGKERGEKRRTGLALAVGGDIDTVPSWKRRQVLGSISIDASGAALRENHGFTLFTAKSEIKHPDAGRGLFVRGRAKPGAVVAFFPGVAYTPPQYRLIEGYPDVVAGNPYLIGRYDGVIVNAKPWGQGTKGRQRWTAAAGGGFAWQDVGEELAVSDAAAGGHAINATAAAAAAASSSPLPLMAVVDRGHPLALGHFANHPPSGMAPNVMALGYDFVIKRDGEEKLLRQFIPNINCDDEVEYIAAEQGVGQKGGNDYKVSRNRVKGVQQVRSVVFVALREVEDEELLRNYRLNPKLERPEWYCPVDEEEERRRWSE